MLWKGSWNIIKVLWQNSSCNHWNAQNLIIRCISILLRTSCFPSKRVSIEKVRNVKSDASSISLPLLKPLFSYFLKIISSHQSNYAKKSETFPLLKENNTKLTIAESSWKTYVPKQKQSCDFFDNKPRSDKRDQLKRNQMVQLTTLIRWPESTQYCAVQNASQWRCSTTYLMLWSIKLW